MILFPNAKINLGLSVLHKRPDGYHNIETALYPVPLCDALEFLPSDKFRLSIYGNEIPGQTEDNLLFKVWKLLQKNHRVPPVEIKLLKSIPPGSGLGGGSSDAIFFLKGLNSLFKLSLTQKAFTDIAVQTGSDCPFFLNNRPSVARGKGEILSDLNLSLSGKFIVIVIPGIIVNTKEAYDNITPGKPSFLPGEAVRLPFKSWRKYVRNDFEPVLFTKYPGLKKIKDTLYSEGAIYASLTGSGSAIYAIFDRSIDLKNKFPDYHVRSGILT